MILAHQGGWDEGLIVAGPLLVIVGLLWLAKRRAVNLDQPDLNQPNPNPSDQSVNDD